MRPQNIVAHGAPPWGCERVARTSRKDGSTKQFIDATVDKSNGKVAAINADSFGENTNNNTIQYSLKLAKDGKNVEGVPAHYQYNQMLDSYSVDGYTYSFDNGATFVDCCPRVQTTAGMPSTPSTTCSPPALSGDDKTVIVASSASPRTYELVKPTAIKYTTERPQRPGRIISTRPFFSPSTHRRPVRCKRNFAKAAFKLTTRLLTNINNAKSS